MCLRSTVAALCFLALSASTPAGSATTLPDRNVNMVAGTEWPGGDPFLQRQNEPSIAVSTRNPLHLLAGANDYRTVDIPGHLGIKVVGDAWLGLFRSTDGGSTWKSTLLPDLPPPLYKHLGMKGLAAADPIVRAGPNGMFYYGGLVFNRDTPPRSAIVLIRLHDFNDKEAGDPVRFLGGSVIDTAKDGPFVDKPWISVDMPRSTSSLCTAGSTPGPHGKAGETSFPSHNVYMVYSRFLDPAETTSEIRIAVSRNCGQSFSTPKAISGCTGLYQGASIAIDPASGAIYVTWRRVDLSGDTDAIMFAKSTDFGLSFSNPQVIATFEPFEQGTTDFSFRTTAYPSMAADGDGGIHVAWAQRGRASAGDSRIVVSSSTDQGATWTAPSLVDASPFRSHQFMPSLTFANGSLTLVYYDHRQDHTIGIYQPDAATGSHTEARQQVGDLPNDPWKVFWDFIADALPPNPPAGSTAIKRRHTLDVWAAQAEPGQPFATARVSQYMYGSRPGSDLIEQLQFNSPNLKLFRQGTVPFIGDYIDVAAKPFVFTSAGWQFNTASSRAPVFHAVWTDNRDVRPPADGNWANYTPVFSSSNTGTSRYDGSPVPPCVAGQTGMRNQNIYTTRITRGLFAGSPGNAKQLGTIQRAYVVFVQNTLTTTQTYRLTIVNQPPGGKASFLQIPQAAFPDPLTVLDVSVLPRSTIARSVFVTSSDPRARVDVDVVQLDPLNGIPVMDGLQETVIINPDVANPDVANPDVANPDVANPDVANAEVYNPDVANPDVANPDVANPDVANPDVANPDVANPDVANPDVANPDVANPDVANPDVANPDVANPDVANPDVANTTLTDTTWTTSNTGNTSASYSVNLLINGGVPAGIVTQLILHKTYRTPVARECTLGTTRQTILLANIPNPEFISDPAALLTSDVTDGSEKNATIWLAPGDSAHITLRVFDPDRHDDVTFDAAKQVVPVTVAHAVSTEALAAGETTPSVSLAILSSRAPDTLTDSGGAYSVQLQAIGGVGTKTWSGSGLPGGFTLSSSGLLQGTVLPPGVYAFSATVTDSRSPVPESQTRQIEVRSLDPLSITTTALADAAPGEPYSATLTKSGGTAPYYWTISAGSLPPGLTLSAAGTISGTPTTAGLSAFTVQLKDGMYPTPQLRTQALQIAVVGENTFVVTNTNDSGAGSLRQAILDANANTGFHDTIVFAIPGAGPHTIAPTSGFLIDDPVIIDGTTQPGYSGSPLVEVDGINAPPSESGLTIAGSSGTTIRGLALTRWGDYGIRVLSDGHAIQSNFIGTADGLTGKGNWRGLLIEGANNLAGGAGAGNVISANQETGLIITGIANVVTGNFIGTDPTGTLDVGNAWNGVQIIDGSSNRIGGTPAGELNVISGNGGEGLRIDGANGTQNAVVSNRIGIGMDGSDLGNTLSGIYIRNAPGNLVTGNIISGNDGLAGVAICGHPTSCGGVPVGIPGSDASTVVEGNQLLGNTVGISIDSSSGNRIGVNIVEFNTSAGIWVGVGTGNRLRFNRVSLNGGLGIELGAEGVASNDLRDDDGGPNNLQNFPVLDSATVGDGVRITGSLHSTPNAQFLVDFHWSPSCDAGGFGEGQTWITSTEVTTDANGDASFVATTAGILPAGVVTAMATSSGNDSSEFSACVAVQLPPPPTIPAQTVRVATRNVPYSHTLLATGGYLPYQWSILDGSLPAGLSLTSSGVISGTCTEIGGAVFTARIFDSTGQSATRAFGLDCHAGIVQFLTQPQNAAVTDPVSDDIVVEVKDTMGLPLQVDVRLSERSNASCTPIAQNFDSLPRTVTSDAEGRAHFGAVTALRGCYGYQLTAEVPAFERTVDSGPFDVFGFGDIRIAEAFARIGHTITYLPDGRVLIAGGVTAGGGFAASAALYDPRLHTLTLAAGPMNFPRMDHTATLLPDGRVLIAGGHRGTRQSVVNVVAEVEIFDLTTGTFTVSHTLARPRSHHTATLGTDGLIYIVGGRDQDGLVSNIEVGNSVVSSLGPPLAYPRILHTATLIGSSIVIIGGSQIPAPQGLQQVEIIRTPALIESGGAILSARTNHTATFLGTDRILVTGGFAGGNVTNTAEIFFANSGSAQPAGAMAIWAANHIAERLEDGNVVLAGGCSDTGTYHGSVQLYETVTNTFRMYGSLSNSRCRMASADIGERIVVLGGEDSTGAPGNVSETFFEEMQ